MHTFDFDLILICSFRLWHLRKTRKLWTCYE